MDGQTFACIQCGAPFVVGATELRIYRERGFDDPKRCPPCRKHRARAELDAFDRKKAVKKRDYRQKYGT